MYLVLATAGYSYRCLPRGTTFVYSLTTHYRVPRSSRLFLCTAPLLCFSPPPIALSPHDVQTCRTLSLHTSDIPYIPLSPHRLLVPSGYQITLSPSSPTNPAIRRRRVSVSHMTWCSDKEPEPVGRDVCILQGSQGPPSGRLKSWVGIPSVGPDLSWGHAGAVPGLNRAKIP